MVLFPAAGSQGHSHEGVSSSQEGRSRLCDLGTPPELRMAVCSLFLCTGAQAAGPAGGDGSAESGTVTSSLNLVIPACWQPVPMEDEARMTEHSDTVMEELKVCHAQELHR